MSRRLGVWGRGGALAFSMILLVGCSPLPEYQSGDQEEEGASGRSAKPSRLSANLFEECQNLEELWLPASTTDLVWLNGSRLKKLRAAETKIQSLRGAPSTLRELDISFTNVKYLDYLPKSVEKLDLRNTRIENLEGLPDSLEYLYLSGSSVQDLSSLPKSLRSLYLHGIRLQDLSILPRGLQELHLVGKEFKNLQGLPQSLRFLSLKETSVGSLKGLPESIQVLRLVGNKMSDDGGLPIRLVDLTIERQPVPVDLSQLKYLVRLSDQRDNASVKLPSSLTSITLKSIRKIPERLPVLRALGLVGVNFDLNENFPPRLERLTLASYKGPGIKSVPKTLKRLALLFVSFSTPPSFPEGIEELRIVRSDPAYLDSAPRGLKRLVICETNLDKLENVAARWPKLEELTICDSPSFKMLGDIPATLRSLDLRGTPITRLPRSIGGLVDLNLSRTGIKLSSFGDLPRSLEELSLTESSVSLFQDFPPKLRALRFCPPSRKAAEVEDEQVDC